MSIVDRRAVLSGMGATLMTGACQTSRYDRYPVKDAGAVVEAFSPVMRNLIDPDEDVYILAEGFKWAEGPAWDPVRQCLYFSDVPSNVIYRWSAADGISDFLNPSGIARQNAQGFREPGANGLMWHDGALLICNHGRRAVERYGFRTRERYTLASEFGGLRFNSPNDLAIDTHDTLFFTDPPYGLDGLNASPLKEMSANGVYAKPANGSVVQLLDDMTFPNGIVCSPDSQYLYIAQSDPEDAYIRRLKLTSDLAIENDVRWFDANQGVKAGLPGLPDGMAMTTSGHIFATGPGGVLVLSPDGQLLGQISLPRPTANCAFGDDGSTLFITSNDKLLRIRTRVMGLVPRV